MKLAIISDLHITDRHLYLDAFKVAIKNMKIDLLIIAGDISDNCYETIEFVNILNKTVRTKYIVGNHDLWNRKNGLTYEQIMKQYRDDENCLLNETMEIGEYKLICSTCWYDYSYGNKDRFTIEQFENKTFKGVTWSDKFYIDSIDDIEKSNKDISFIKKEIANTDKDIILITHIVNHKKFLGWSKRVDWEYFNAFIGNKKLYELTKDKKVKYAICGHVHFRYKFIEDNTTYICACLGNKKEFRYLYENNDLTENIRDSLQIIEI